MGQGYSCARVDSSIVAGNAFRGTESPGSAESLPSPLPWGRAIEGGMSPQDSPRGLALAIGAYLVWGLMPLYLHSLAHVPAAEVIAHRILWSLPIALVVLRHNGQVGTVVETLRQPRLVAMAGLTAVLISANWLVYVWAVSNGQALQAALGYYINPLFNILLGWGLLGERLSRPQLGAVALAAVAVALLTVASGELPVVALSLTRELGPVVAGLLFASRAGSSVTAEIGLMKTTEQLKAMDMMAVNPIARVVAPRFWGGVISMPLLAAMFSAMGVLGGWLIGVVFIGVDDGAFWAQMQASVDFRYDIWNGVIKSIVFGIAVSLIAVFEGFDSVPTAEGVSRAITRTVVTSAMAILALDFILTSFMFRGTS